MAKEITKIINLQIPAGKATPAPPVGTVLGPAGINLGEFVTKYNKQSSSLKKLTAVLVGGLAILGGIFGVKSEKKIWKPLGVIAGALSGLCVGAIISKEKRNKLMDKYEVKDVSE